VDQNSNLKFANKPHNLEYVEAWDFNTKYDQSSRWVQLFVSAYGLFKLRATKAPTCEPFL